MAPMGEVFAQQTDGNFKVMPHVPCVPYVVLRNSAQAGLKPGDVVVYGSVSQIKLVNFAGLSQKIWPTGSTLEQMALKYGIAGQGTVTGRDGMRIGRDGLGHFLVRPDGSPNMEVTLIDSEDRRDLAVGNHVTYWNPWVDAANKKIVGASSYKPEDLEERLRRLVVIDYALGNAKADGAKAIIVYDPKHPSYEFIAIAKDPKAASSAIDAVHRLSGFGGVGRGPNSDYTGTNGLRGVIHHVSKDFRPSVHNNERQGEFSFVPVGGLAKKEYHFQSPIPREAFERSVEAARL